MAHNARIRPDGFWTLGSVVDPMEWEALDAAQFASVHEGGGTWAFAEQAVFGGLGLRMTGPLDLAGTCVVIGEEGVTFTGELTFTDDCALALTGTSFLLLNSGTSLTALAGTTVSLRGAVAFTATSVTTFSVGAEIHGDVTVASGANIALASGAEIILASGADLTLNSGSDLNCAGTAVFAGNTTQSGAHARTGSETISGSGATTAWRCVTCADANTTYSVADGDYFRIRKTLTAGTTIYVLSKSPTPPTGTVMRFFRPATAGNNVEWQDSVGNNYATIDEAVGYVWFEFDGSNWIAVNWSANVTPSATY